MGKDLGIGIPREPDLQLEDHGKKASSTVTETEKDEFPDLGSENDGGKVEKEKLGVNSETLNKELRKETADLIGAMTHCTNRQMETAAVTVPNDNIKDMAICSTKEIPSLELSLKRRRDGGEIGTSAQERNVLRHSDLSAFSRCVNHKPTELYIAPLSKSRNLNINFQCQYYAGTTPVQLLIRLQQGMWAAVLPLIIAQKLQKFNQGLISFLIQVSPLISTQMAVAITMIWDPQLTTLLPSQNPPVRSQIPNLLIIITIQPSNQFKMAIYPLFHPWDPVRPMLRL